MEKKNYIKVIEILKLQYPDVKCELIHSNPFELLIATMLSAQSTDKTVNKVTGSLFKKFKTPVDFLALSQEELEKEIKEIGIYRNKAKNILLTCNRIIKEYGGMVPNSLNELITLPGVGRKTANVVLSNAFGIPAIAVDTHVFRVSNRIGLAKSNKVDEVEKQLMSGIPELMWTLAHHLLIRHGREICNARKPKCEICVISDHCNFCYENTFGKYNNMYLQNQL